MSRRRYSGYHGRETARNGLRCIFYLLVIVLALVAAGLMFGQRYLVYTDDGVHLELPFFRREEMPAMDESAPVDIVQLPGAPKPQPVPQPEEDNTAVNETEEHQSEHISG